MRRIYLLTMLIALAATFAWVPLCADEDATKNWRAPFNAAERAALEYALEAANLTFADLEFDRFPIRSAFLLKTVERMMAEPLYNAELAHQTGIRMHRAAVNPIPVLGYMRGLLDFENTESCAATPSEALCIQEMLGTYESEQASEMRKALDEMKFIHEDIYESLVRVLWSARNLDLAVEASLSKLNGEERELVSVFLLRAFLEYEGEELDKHKAQLEKLGISGLLELCGKIDLSTITYMSKNFIMYVNDLKEVLLRTNLQSAGFPAHYPKVILTPLGEVVFGSHGNDEYNSTHSFIIEPGGNDRYNESVAMSAGLLKSDSFWSRCYTAASFLIDIAGDDTYKGLNVAAAFGGAAVLIDCAGDDFFKTSSFSCGAAIFGIGALINLGGDDIYIGDTFCQGAGLFGIGLLADNTGNDIYRAAKFAQGFGYTMGIGALSDDEGVDNYFAGGKYLHIPLLPTNYQSLSQGFGFGMRDAASGGIGILADASGNDTYSVEVYGHGSSYWLAGGILVDGGGNDIYTSTHYCAGTGIHLSAGILLDRSGNDHYFCKNGVGVGGSHDYAVGLLCDLEGDDYYQVSGCGIGAGHTNGVGILLDGGAGYDGYSANHSPSIGGASETRNSGSIGILIDMGGPRDTYSDGLKNGELRVKNAYGVAYDVPDKDDEEVGTKK